MSAAASARFGVTSVARPIRSWSTPAGAPLEQRRAVARARAPGRSRSAGGAAASSSRRPSSTLRATSSVASMPSFTASGGRSRSSTRSCASTTFGNTGSTSVHLRGVLHGERGDHARAVHTKGAKDLEIRLEPGAAGRIRAGDAEGDSARLP